MNLTTLRLMAADLLAGKPLVSRSSKWPKVRAAHLRDESVCQVCGRKDRLEVHHIVPVHVDPTLELVLSNLLTLCNCGHGGCHLLVGHLGLFASWNINVRTDAAVWQVKITNRPPPPDCLIPV